MSEVLGKLEGFEDSVEFLRNIILAWQKRVDDELRYLDSAIDMDRKRLEVIEGKIKVLDSRYDEAGGQAGWAIDSAQKSKEQFHDLLRWRKWPEEIPPVEGQYLVSTDRIGVQVANYFRDFTQWSSRITHWRPIGPLPGGE